MTSYCLLLYSYASELLLFSSLFVYTKPRDWLGDTLAWELGRKTTTQSVSQSTLMSTVVSGLCELIQAYAPRRYDIYAHSNL